MVNFCWLAINESFLAESTYQHDLGFVGYLNYYSYDVVKILVPNVGKKSGLNIQRKMERRQCSDPYL